MLRVFRRRPKEPEPPWRSYRSDSSPLVLAGGPSSRDRDRTLWSTLGEFLAGFVGIFRRGPKGPPPPPELDEDGYPVTWRIDPFLDPYFQGFLVKSADHWPIFSKWCEVKSRKALPASEETVLMFLLDSPVEGRYLYETWWAIFFRHEAYYWMEDVDPVYLLRRKGVDVKQGGTVIAPEEVKRQFGL